MYIHPRDAIYEHEYKRQTVTRDIAVARYELAWTLFQLGRLLYWSGKQVSAWGCRLQTRLILRRKHSAQVHFPG